MLIAKHSNLKPLLESMDGVHLTAYLVNNGELIDLKSQLRTTIDQSFNWLQNAMSPKEREKFLEPLESLLSDARIFKRMKGNIGIFRNEDTFRIVNIPIHIEQSCQVATSFHIKPLLRWLQDDQDFLFLGLEENTAYLYSGSQHSFKLIDSIDLPEFLKSTKEIPEDFTNYKRRLLSFNKVDSFKWLSGRISDLTKNSNPKIFFAGDPRLVHVINQSLKYKNTVPSPITSSFNSYHAKELCRAIRNVLKDESRKSFEKALLEFRYAEEGNRAKKNIFQISKAVIQGKVRKLVVTDEISIFGKIDIKSGGLAIHPFDLDHEDDCILDDLAQMVLSQGGDVIIAKRNEIPKGRPILAILDDEKESLVKTEELQFEDLHYKIG